MGKIADAVFPHGKRSQNQIPALTIGEIPQWRRLKLKGKLWRYLWKARFISAYRLKKGWNS
jgi:hypothetical protein